MKLVHWPLMGGLLQFWYSEEGPGWAAAPPSPLLAVPNVTAAHQRPVYQSPYCCIMVRCSAVLMCSYRVNKYAYGTLLVASNGGGVTDSSCRVEILRCKSLEQMNVA